MNNQNIFQQLEKEGKCPNYWLLPSSCREECKEDEDCSGNLKCCSNGCGRLCSEPLTNHIEIATEGRVF